MDHIWPDMGHIRPGMGPLRSGMALSGSEEAHLRGDTGSLGLSGSLLCAKGAALIQRHPHAPKAPSVHEGAFVPIHFWRCPPDTPMEAPYRYTFGGVLPALSPLTIAEYAAVCECHVMSENANLTVLKYFPIMIIFSTRF